MSFSHLLDLIVVSVSVAAVVIVSFYTKHKIEIDERAAKGDRVAMAQQIVAQAVTPLVYQAEKRGGAGEEKMDFVINGLNLIPINPTAQFTTNSFLCPTQYKFIPLLNSIPIHSTA